jgi:hypothetical protein
MAKVHKDFYGAFSYGLEHLYKKYGEKEVITYLRQVGRNVYKPLSMGLKKEGLSALEKHWRKVFSLEEADFSLSYEGKVLVLKVNKCPAIHHLRTHNYPIFKKFCEHTRIVNEEICSQAGYQCSVDYDQNKGECLQRFWK